MTHLLRTEVFNGFGEHRKKKVWKHDNYSDYPGIGIVYDADVGRYAFKHLRLRDRFDPEKVGNAVLVSQTILFGIIKEDELPKKKNWKFFRDF